MNLTLEIHSRRNLAKPHSCRPLFSKRKNQQKKNLKSYCRIVINQALVLLHMQKIIMRAKNQLILMDAGLLSRNPLSGKSNVWYVVLDFWLLCVIRDWFSFHCYWVFFYAHFCYWETFGLQVGRERHSAFCLMQKYVDLKYLGNKLQIISAFSVDHIKGFIYIEPEKQQHIYKVVLYWFFIFCVMMFLCLGLLWQLN